MKNYSLLTFLCLLFSVSVRAFNVYSVTDGYWDDTLTWSNHQIPSNPDSLFIDHYIVFSNDITVNAPTVLTVSSSGTLCGDFMLIQNCGSKIFNYGHIYIHQGLIKDMWNYNEFSAKVYVSITGCSISGYGNGFFNIPPNGTAVIWPSVPCRSSGTNWNPNAITENFYSTDISIFPNPSHDFFIIDSKSDLHIRIYNTFGACIIEQNLLTGKNKINTSMLAPGIYFFIAETGGTFHRILIIE